MINYSHFQGVSFDGKSGVVSALIRRLPLAAGLYRLHLRILLGEEEIYWNTCLRMLSVDAGDFYGTGVRGEENLCPWLQNVEWRATYAE